MYIGAMQAVKLITNKAKKGSIYNLDKLAQAKTLKRWIKDKNYTGNLASFKQSDVERIVNYNTLENGVEMSSVWK
jgi:selenophosphate synthetase-related protein